MKLYLTLKGLFIVLLCGMSSQHPVSQNSFYQFAQSIYYNVLSNNVEKDTNVVISPASIQACTTLLYMGATGETASQMKTALALDKFENKLDVATAYQQFFEALSKKPEVVMANRLYVANGVELKPEFKDIASGKFHVGVEKVNFEKNEETAKIVNQWVSEKTNGKIQNILNSDTINGNTVAVLLNAIYFKADWTYPFKYTSSMPFMAKSDVAKNVPTMFLWDASLSYTTLENFNADVMEFPYKNSDLKMYIILPNVHDYSFDHLEDKFSMEMLKAHSWTRGLVEVRLPKFKIEADIDMIPVLKKMGMQRAFGNAEFGDLLATPRPITIDQVKHKAFIAVDELGTEASAATLIGARFLSAGPTPKYFNVDRPFMFVISDASTVYFQGRVFNP